MKPLYYYKRKITNVTNKQPPLEIIVLAAGKGTRMKSALPKVLHRLAGTSLLQHVINTALLCEPQRIQIVVGHGADEVSASISHPQIEWVKQTKQLGTGHAVQQAIASIADKTNVLVLYGDVPLITNTTLSKLVDCMSGFSLAVLTAILQWPSGYGRILHDNNGEVCGIIEQKDATEEQKAINEINTGFICARSTQLKTWLAQLDNNNAQQEYYLTDIVQLAYQAGEPIGTIQPSNNNEIMGVNSRIELAQLERIKQRKTAEKLMAKGVTIIDPDRIDIRGDVQIGQDTIIDVNCVIEGPTTIGSNVAIQPNCVISECQIDNNTTIHSHTVLQHAVIGQHVNIGPFARIRPGTQLADHVRIGNFVETKNVQMARGAKANHLSYVGDAEVGEDTNIGAGVITCNYDGANKHKTSIGNNVFVGSDSQLVAPVTIEDGATIGAGSTITNNVNADQLAVSRARQRLIDDWQRPSSTKTSNSTNNNDNKKKES